MAAPVPTYFNGLPLPDIDQIATIGQGRVHVAGRSAALPYFDVRRYGATGDGVTNDITAIQATITAAATVPGGGVVLFPRGIYLVNSAIIVPSFIRLEGVGSVYRATEYGIDPANSFSVIKHGVGTFNLIENSDPINGNVSIELRSLRLIQAAESGNAAVVRWTKVRRSLISDCYLQGAATTNRFGLLHDGSSEHNAVERCTFEGCGIRSTTANKLSIRSCEIGAGGISLFNGFDHCVVGCDIFNNGVSGSFDPYPNLILVDRCTGAMIEGNQLAASLQHGIFFTAGVKRSIVRGNTVKDCGRQTANTWSGIALDSGIAATPTEYNVVSGNVCWDNLGVTGTQRYGITVTSSSGSQTNNNVFANNILDGNRTAGGNQVAGLSNLWEGNSGYGAQALWGTGTPEGVVTASVGSTFMRVDGGAGTSFYVKESGTGNTGWVAK